MRRKRKLSPLGLGIIIVIIISILFTIIIVHKLVSKKVSVDSLEGTEIQNYTYKNTYIYETKDQQIKFLYKGKRYKLNGGMNQEYIGVADIEIENNEIKKIYTKQDFVSGIIQSYTDTDMQIDGYGIVKRQSEIPVYFVEDNDVSQYELGDLIIGYSNVQYVLEGDSVVAILARDLSYADSIHVLIKNKDLEYWEDINIDSSEKYDVFYLDEKANEVLLESRTNEINVKEYMKEHMLSFVHLKSDKGSFYICDRNSNYIGNEYPTDFICILQNDQIYLINCVGIEEYVRRVLPSEMMHTFSFEALKAQAVCARTFAYSQLTNNTYARYGANIDDTTAFQVYNKGEASEETNLAVEETNGQIICNAEGLITCYYFSTSPGYTENMEVWQQENVDYLQHVNGTNQEMKDLSDENVFLEFLNGQQEGFDRESPFYRWTAELDLSKLCDQTYGEVVNIQVLKRSSCGYITELKVVFENGEKSIYNENEIRNYLGKALKKVALNNNTTRNDFSALPSACFAITDYENQNCFLNGAGFGHGIGMSQYGANQMGKDGKSYREIIEFYYTNVFIESVRDLTR